jgi:hypothetical protein
MSWQSDSASEAQLRFLERLGSAIKPETKGAASELIDRLLGGKNHKSRNPRLKLHTVKDVNQRIDDAAEQARRQLDHANKTPRYQRPKADPEATSSPGMLRVRWPDAPDEEAGGRDDHLDSGQHRGPEEVGAGEMAGETAEEDSHRSEDAVEGRTGPAEHGRRD